MEKITIENYDGEKGYRGKDKFDVVELGGKRYLVPRWAFVGPWCGNREEIDAYKIVEDHVKSDSATAIRIKDRKTLTKIIEKRTKDFENI